MNRTMMSLLLFGSLLLASQEKLAKDLPKGDSGQIAEVIVQFRQAPTDVHHRKVTGRGGKLRAVLTVVNGGHYSIPASALAALAADPDVLYISPDRDVQGALDYATPTVGADIALRNGWDGVAIAAPREIHQGHMVGISQSAN